MQCAMLCWHLTPPPPPTAPWRLAAQCTGCPAAGPAMSPHEAAGTALLMWLQWRLHDSAHRHMINSCKSQCCHACQHVLSVYHRSCEWGCSCTRCQLHTQHDEAAEAQGAVAPHAVCNPACRDARRSAEDAKNTLRDADILMQHTWSCTRATMVHSCATPNASAHRQCGIAASRGGVAPCCCCVVSNRCTLPMSRRSRCQR
jgi:hypothetical protein